MTKHVPKLLTLATLFLFAGFTVQAHDFEAVNSDGDTIYYRRPSAYVARVQVTFRGDRYDTYRNEYRGVVNIPDSVTHNGTTYAVYMVAAEAFSGCDSLTAVTLPETVTSIDNEAFKGCRQLTSINIPSSLNSIGNGAFFICSSLTSINIPSSLNSIGNSAFSGCSSLTSITLPSSMTSIGEYLFYGCSSLASIEIPSSVTSIGMYAFSYCSALTEISIPSSVTSIGVEAFSYCTNLASVSLPSSVSLGHSVFYSCTGLTEITIPESWTTIEQSTFSHCTGLSSVTIPSSVTTIKAYAFNHCTNLMNLSIPSSVETIEMEAFKYVRNVIYNGTATGAPWGAFAINGYVDGNLVYADATKTTLLACAKEATEVTIPSTVDTIAFAAFYGCSDLTDISIPSSVSFIDVCAFQECTNLASVSLPSNITMIPSQIFYNCTSLTSIVIPSSVSSIETEAFWGCSSLSSITLPSSLTTIEDYAFAMCNGLTTITLPETVTRIGSGAFSVCNNLTGLFIPSTVEVIERMAFYDVRNVIYHGTLTPDEYNPWGELSMNGYVDGLYVYEDSTRTNLLSVCAAVTELELPSSVTTIGRRAFSHCNNITSIEIPASVSSLGAGVFSGCSRLAAVTIPGSVSLIRNSSFDGCDSLKALTLLANIPPRAAGNALSGPIPFMYQTTLYVPCIAIDKYHEHNTWGNFRDIVGIASVKSDAIPYAASIEQGVCTVAWAKNYAVESYNIYRQIADGDYELAANVSYSDEAQWVDSSQLCQSSAVKYKIASVDNCGFETGWSGAVGTIYLVARSSEEGYRGLEWCLPEGISLDDLQIYRGTTEDDLQPLTAVGADNTAYHDLQAPEGRVLYQVRGSYYSDFAEKNVEIRSNVSMAFPVGIEDLANMNQLWQLRSEQGALMISGAEGETLYIYDAYGRLLKQIDRAMATERYEVPAAGLYLVKMQGGMSRKITVVK